MPDETSPTDEDAAPGREYVEITPTNASLPRRIDGTVRRLYRLGDGPDDRSVVGRLVDRLRRRRHVTPTVEFLLVADGDGSVRYYAGVDPPDLLDPLETALRRLFPNAYDLRRVERGADWLAPSDDDADDATAGAPVAVEFGGTATYRRDWQTPLAPFESFDADTRVPLSSLAETMASRTGRMAYQVLVRPTPDWSAAADDYAGDIRAGTETYRGVLAGALVADADETVPGPVNETAEQRLEAVREATPHRSFQVNARLVAVPGNDDAGVSFRPADATGALAALDGRFYAVDGRRRTGDAARAVLDDVRDRTTYPPAYDGLRERLPFTTNWSRGMVVGAPALPGLWLLDGSDLTDEGTRALDRTASERTGVPRPPDGSLETFRGEGLSLGVPRTADGAVDDDPLALPPDLQRLHAAWFGRTGSGKSTGLLAAMLDNREATDGADVLVDPKGDGLATRYCRAHYARHGHLDDVLYFDCAELLPAIPFFDVRDDLAAGRSRASAVADVVDHYLEILVELAGDEQFNRALRAPDVVRYLVRAQFDPEHGDDAFSHRDLQAAARTLHEQESPPPVTDPDLAGMLAGLVANDDRTFDRIMAGVANRLEKVPVDPRLARLFNHVPDRADPDASMLDFGSLLDDDVTVLFDLGGLRSAAQRALTLVVLSELWTALKRRSRRDPDADHPLVNVYLEEAAAVADTDLLGELLAQARGFDCSLTLAMQFPGQLDDDVYEEVLNNVGTVVAGNVPADRRLPERLATDDMPPGDVANRLRALSRGEWLVGLPTGFGDPPPRPFVVESLPQPAGVPDGPAPLSDGAEAVFDAEMQSLRERTAETAGLEFDGADSGVDGEGVSSTAELTGRGVDSPLRYTTRLPQPVAYVEDAHALRCKHCDNRYDATLRGMRRAIGCCAGMDAVDRKSVPVCDVGLKLSNDEIRNSEWSVRQLLFLQAVHDAQQGRLDDIEYNIVRDSMSLLREYVGIDKDAVEELLEAGLVHHDHDRPHLLYSVHGDGRDVLDVSLRHGIDFGDGIGDLRESSQHVLGVELGRRWLEAEYVADPGSPVSAVRTYYEVDDNQRIDAVGLDDDRQVVVTVEVELLRMSNSQGVTEDYDKMAALDPEEAIWIVPSEEVGCKVVETLHEPPDGVARVPTSYSENTTLSNYAIDADGFTEVVTIIGLYRMLDLYS